MSSSHPKASSDHALRPQDKRTGLSTGLTNYGDTGFSLFLRKAFIKGAGYTDSALEKPVIAITNTGSAYNPCHGNMPQLVEAVKRGIPVLQPDTLRGKDAAATLLVMPWIDWSRSNNRVRAPSSCTML